MFFDTLFFDTLLHCLFCGVHGEELGGNWNDGIFTTEAQVESCEDHIGCDEQND